MFSLAFGRSRHDTKLIRAIDRELHEPKHHDGQPGVSRASNSFFHAWIQRDGEFVKVSTDDRKLMKIVQKQYGDKFYVDSSAHRERGTMWYTMKLIPKG
jgi:hypothetical protein